MLNNGCRIYSSWMDDKEHSYNLDEKQMEYSHKKDKWKMTYRWKTRSSRGNMIDTQNIYTIYREAR